MDDNGIMKAEVGQVWRCRQDGRLRKVIAVYDTYVMFDNGAKRTRCRLLKSGSIDRYAYEPDKKMPYVAEFPLSTDNERPHKYQATKIADELDYLKTVVPPSTMFANRIISAMTKASEMLRK